MSIAECYEISSQENPQAEAIPGFSVISGEPGAHVGDKVKRSRTKRNELMRLKDIAGELLGEKSPPARCMHLVTDSQGVPVRYSLEKQQGYIEHVRTCNHVHICPVCARREFEHWKETILKVCAVANHLGYSALTLVLTAQHSLNRELLENQQAEQLLEQQLRGTLSAVIESWRHVFAGERTGVLAPLARVKHQVKHLETRFSPNGYHPHLHALILVDERNLPEEQRGAYEDELRDVIYNRYKAKLQALGYEIAPQGYYCQPVRTWGAAARYMEKLEANLEPALELTQSETKKSERSYSMFQLLALYERGQRSVFGWKISDVFTAFSKGIKGRRAFTLSENISELLGMSLKELREREDKERREEAKKRQEQDILLAVIDTQLWWYLVKNKLVLALYQCADTGSAENVEAFLFSARQSMEVSRSYKLHGNTAKLSSPPEEPPNEPPEEPFEEPPSWLNWTD